MSDCATMTVLTRPGFDRDVPTVVDSDALSGPGRVSNDIGSRRGFFMSVIERLFARVEVSESTGCWVWTGGRNGNGYGHLSVLGARRSVHRAAYEVLVGPIPDGLTLDHLCKNRACFNVDHLEPVSNRENVLRGVGPTAENARKTHCKNGHEFTPENTYTYPSGRRQCRPCYKRLHRVWQRAQRRAGAEGGAL